MSLRGKVEATFLRAGTNSKLIPLNLATVMSHCLSSMGCACCPFRPDVSGSLVMPVVTARLQFPPVSLVISYVNGFGVTVGTGSKIN